MIRSKKPAIYTLRSKEEAIIEVSITEWKYEPMNERYVATVQDCAIINDGEIETKLLINSKQVYYSNAQIDGLFHMLGNPIKIDESYSSELVRLIASALLYVTQTDLYTNNKTIYGLDPEDWEINQNYSKFSKNK